MGFWPWSAGLVSKGKNPTGIFRRILLHSLILLPLLPLGLEAQKSSLEQGVYRIEITLEQFLNNKWIAIDPGLVLPSQTFVRFRVRTNFSGFLYVVNLGTNGNYSLLFPRAETGLENKVEAERDYMVPALEGGYRITGPPGYEIVYWLISTVELRPGSESTAFPVPAPTHKPMGKLIPRCNDKMFRARGECIDISAGPQAVENKDQLPENLTALQGNMAARELQFSRREERAVVSTPRSAVAPVLFEFRLAHR